MVSCEKPSGDDVAPDPKPEVVEILSQKSMEVSPHGELVQVAFYSSGSWTAELVYQGTDNWCNITPASGSMGECAISIAVEGNNTDESRSVKLVVTSGEAYADIDLCQHYVEYLTLSHDAVEMGAEGGLLEVGVASNVAVSVEVPQACIWVKYIGCTEDKKHKFSIEENTGASVRSVDVIFRGGRSDLSERIKITQDNMGSYEDGLDSDISVPGYNEDEWI